MRYVPLALAVVVILVSVALQVILPNIERGRLLPPDDARVGETRVFEVKAGQGASTIARGLQGANVIRDARAFLGMLRHEGWETRLKPGVYQLPLGRHARDVARQIVDGDTWTLRVTIPEGLTLREIAARIERAGTADKGHWLPSAKRLLEAATPALIADEAGIQIPADSAEGYLFPATYALAAGSSAEDVVAVLAGEFAARFAGRHADEIARNPMSLHELVTLASIVEKEAASDKERPLIARVFLNRLRIGMKLESCATVQYALPERKSRLLYADLEINSPYNTYRHTGLPPGPICSPGEASLLAALRPGQTDALYFVAKGDGTHAFSKTFAEHEKAIREWRK